MRRELKEKIDLERQSLGLMKPEKFRVMPKETDAFGTAIRMRPETPKINLLQIQQEQHQRQMQQILQHQKEMAKQQRFGSGNVAITGTKQRGASRSRILEPLPDVFSPKARGQIWIDQEETKQPVKVNPRMYDSGKGFTRKLRGSEKKTPQSSEPSSAGIKSSPSIDDDIVVRSDFDERTPEPREL